MSWWRPTRRDGEHRFILNIPPNLAFLPSGIGKSITARLLSDGFTVVATGRNAASTVLSLRDGTAVREADLPRLHVVAADLATPSGPADAVAAALRHVPRIDVLVNNAGAGYIGQHVATASMGLFDELFALNVRAPFFLVQAALPHMLRTGGPTTAGAGAAGAGAAEAPVPGAFLPVIVNLSSVAAQRPFAGMGPYCASKAAVDMLTQSCALELAGKGIRVVGIAPGTIQTNFHAAAGMGEETASAYYKASAGTHPLGRVGTGEDIADAVSFVISPRASFITGATLVVDGGRLLTASTASQLGGAPAAAAAAAAPAVDGK